MILPHWNSFLKNKFFSENAMSTCFWRVAHFIMSAIIVNGLVLNKQTKKTKLLVSN